MWQKRLLFASLLLGCSLSLFSEGEAAPTFQSLIEKSIALAKQLEVNNEQLREQLSQSTTELTASKAHLQQWKDQSEKLQQDLEKWQADYRKLTEGFQAFSTDWGSLKDSWATMESLYKSYLDTFTEYRKSAEERIRFLEVERTARAVGAGVVGIGLGLLIGYAVFGK